MVTAALAILVAMGTVLFGTLVGWATHWMLHRPWSGRLYRAHMTHHLRKYPPGNLLSDTYRDSGKDDGLFVFVPIIATAELLYMASVWALGVPFWGIAFVAAESIFIGWLHNYTHEGFHLNAFWMDRFAWFRSLRSLHWLHHRNHRKNLGIVWFGWDRILGTFRSPKAGQS